MRNIGGFVPISWTNLNFLTEIRSRWFFKTIFRALMDRNFNFFLGLSALDTAANTGRTGHLGFLRLVPDCEKYSRFSSAEALKDIGGLEKRLEARRICGCTR